MLAFGVLGLSIVANYLAAQTHEEWDLTKDALFTLHRQSREVASRLDQPITVYGFFEKSAPERGTLAELVRLYQRDTSQISLELLEPDRVPQRLAKQFDLRSGGPRIVVRNDARHVKLKEPSEQGLTNALIELSERAARQGGFRRRARGARRELEGRPGGGRRGSPVASGRWARGDQGSARGRAEGGGPARPRRAPHAALAGRADGAR
ncbi:MAG: hypothetical protein HC923_12700 [Myxococcales bacterium]|nr:hypothetical protein [Myxococcales bacterium]